MNPFFPLRRLFCCSFLCVSLCFSLAFFFAFPFFMFSLLVFLSLSLSCYFLSSLLPVSHLCFWCMPFVIGLFAFCFKIFFSFLFFFLPVVLFVLNHISDLFLFRIKFSSCCCFLLFHTKKIWPPIKTSLKYGNSKNSKHKKRRKKRTFRQEQLGQVCSQTVFFVVLLSLFLLKTL